MGLMIISNILIVALLRLTCVHGQDLKLGFYEKSCPNAERMISDFVRGHISNAPSLAAPLLRMHFHDCFVRGCDGSVLLNATSTDQAAEKLAQPNQSLRGFDFIDRVKSLVEEECPGVVSCADVLALVARDAIETIGGPTWRVPTGRRDGLISNASEASTNIPSPRSSNFTTLLSSFVKKGLNMTDLVILSGAHTIGMAHCSAFSNRLYNFTGDGDTHTDPSLDSLYVSNLRMNKCRRKDDNTTIVEMDPGSFRTFDLGYYQGLLKRRGLFQSDAALVEENSAKNIIVELVESPLRVFYTEFALSMEKMGGIEVKTGSSGEIRKNCAVVNHR